MNWKELKQDYENRLQNIKSVNTRRTYIYAMERWDFADKPTVSSIMQRIEEFKKEGLSGKTIALWASAVRYMLKNWPEEFAHVDSQKMMNIFSEIKIENVDETFASEEQAKAIINHSDNRVALCVALMYYAGLRISEVANLKIPEGGHIQVKEHTSRGSSNRTILIADNLNRLIKTYIVCERADCANLPGFKPTNNLIVSRRGATNAAYLARLVKKACRDCGFPNLHDHSFRHGFANKLVMNDINLEGIRYLMGHQNISTTKRYIAVQYDSMLQQEDYDKMMAKSFEKIL